MRGFLGGVSVGALVAVGGAAIWSLSVPLPGGVDVTVDVAEEAVAKPGAPEEVAPPGDAPARDADVAEALPPELKSSQDDDLSALAGADTSPAGRPEIGGSGDAPALQAGDGQSAPEIALQTDKPAVPVEALPGPDAPSQEGNIVVSTEPAQPPAPEPEPADPAAANATDAGSESADVAAEADPAADSADQSADAEETSETAPAPQVAVEAPSFKAPEFGTAPAAPALPGTGSTAPGGQGNLIRIEEPAAGTAGAEEESGEDDNRIAELPTADAPDSNDGPGIGTRVVPLTERGQAVEATPVAAPEAIAADPFEAYSVAFENTDGRPLMSIVLIDDETATGVEALEQFPYPLSFAIDPEDPQAAEKIAARRAAGFEVLMLADLPREAAPRDAETAFSVWFDMLPETVGVLEGVDTGFQGNRALADHVAAIMAATGRGMVTQNSGLNTVQKLALRDGVPAGVVFRDFDGAGQDPRAIRRFLDQAAFRAGQEGAVIMLGRLQPDTISALLQWGLQDRSSRVAMAPVSASLKAKMQDSPN